jgi:hypothetical protein
MGTLHGGAFADLLLLGDHATSGVQEDVVTVTIFAGREVIVVALVNDADHFAARQAQQRDH